MTAPHAHEPPRACVLIPIYNNKDTIAGVVDRMAPTGLPCLIVDDGSDAATRAVLTDLARRDSVRVTTCPTNGGKGAAVKVGLRLARELGYTHALQVDADGQHCLEDAPRFLAAAAAQPDALVLGTPVFGPEVPRARLHGRKLSVWMAAVETLSGAVADPLFGYRVYPVAAACAVLDGARVGNRMDFDPEIAVRLYWHGCPIINLPSAVVYPEGGTSHFRMLADNAAITWLHTRLTFGMIWRLPRLLARHFRKHPPGPRTPRSGGRQPQL